jgi:hypothetical protein
MSDHLEELKHLQAEVDGLTPEQFEQRIRHMPKPAFNYTRKNPTRRNLPNWLEGQEKFLKDHYHIAIESGQLESDLDTDGFACEKLEGIYQTALNTIYLAEDAWNHREQNRPGTEIELALRELVHIRVDDYVREYLRHFRYRKPKDELVKAVLASYPQLRKALVEGQVSHLVVGEFIYGKCGVSVSDNTISHTLRDCKLVEK